MVRQPDGLPTDEDGGYVEGGPGTELIEEIEPFDPRTTESLMLDLEAGNYVLICNIVEIEDEKVEARYALS